MKIGILCKPLENPFSGSGSHLKGLLGALDTFSESVDITLLSYTKLDSSFEFSFKNIILSGNYLYDCYLINKLNFDIVHLHPLTIKTPIFYSAKKVTTIHGASGVTLRKDFGFFRYFHDKFIRSFLCRFISHVFTVSECSAEWLISNYNINPSLISVIPNGISPEISGLYTLKSNRISFSERNSILHVSNYSRRKNPLMVLRIFKILVEQFSDLKFIIVGNGWNNSVVHDYLLINNLIDKIIIKGFVSDSELASYYYKSKVYFSPSLYEGFGMPNIESMFCGTPIVISDAFAAGSVAGPAAHITKDPNDLDFFILSISKLICDETYWLKFSSSSVKHSKKFDWGISAEKTINVYKKLLD